MNCNLRISRVQHPAQDLLETVVRLQERVFGCYRPGRFLDLKALLADPETSCLYLAFNHGEPVGFAMARHCIRRHEWVISGIGVDSPYRQRGLGLRLLSATVTGILSCNMDRIVSYVDRGNIPSLNLHRRAGFRPERSAVLPASELRQRMVFSGHLSILN